MGGLLSTCLYRQLCSASVCPDTPWNYVRLYCSCVHLRTAHTYKDCRQHVVPVLSDGCDRRGDHHLRNNVFPSKPKRTCRLAHSCYSRRSFSCNCHVLLELCYYFHCAFMVA